MSFLYYFTECPTCKNASRNLVREAALHQEIKLDERYIYVLPDLWEKEARSISRATGEPLPLVYNTETKEALFVNAEDEEMRQRLADFFSSTSTDDSTSDH